jgi:hypothetical protein
MELARLKGVPESIDTTPVNIWLVFVPSPTDLVEIAKDQPTHPTKRLVSHKLREEVILSVARGWAIHRRDFEIAITRRVEDVHIGREAKLGSNDVRHVQNGVIPKEQNPPSSPDSRALGEATQPIAANVGSIKGGDGRKFSFLQTHNVARGRGNGRMDGVFTIRNKYLRTRKEHKPLVPQSSGCSLIRSLAIKIRAPSQEGAYLVGLHGYFGTP